MAEAVVGFCGGIRLSAASLTGPVSLNEPGSELLFPVMSSYCCPLSRLVGYYFSSVMDD